MAEPAGWRERLSFAFDDAALEREFLTESYANSLNVVRFGIVLAAVLYALFSVLDIYMMPGSHRTVWLIRFALVIPFFGAIFLASFARTFERVHVPLIVLTSVVAGAGILAMTYYAQPAFPPLAAGGCPGRWVARGAACMEPGYHSYYTGVLLVIIWIGTFSQLRFWHATHSVLVILGLYLAVTMGRHGMTADGFGNPDFAMFINNSFFLLGAAILAVFSAWAFERSKRSRFLQTRAIAQEKARTQVLLQRIETLFGQQVSEEVARELVSGPGQVESRLCQVTVMFLDIRDFTAFADSREPAEVASFQNTVFSGIIDIIRAHRGVINQILGDGIMATFGAPVPNPTHVTDAVGAGFRIIERVDQLAADGTIPPIRVGIALHTGQVLAGNIGNQFRKQYSLTGGTVNIAARIEQLNKEHGSRFLVSDAVYCSLKQSDVPAESLGEIQLRGVGRPISLYRLA